MKLLAGTSYDPAAAVTKATTALLAMTAFDTTNLRLNATVPASGIVRWRITCTVHGATTLPSVLIGVMNGASVLARMAPMVGGGNLIASGRYQLEATGVISGLTPSASVNFDAAYGVEVTVASTGIKYGGPNNTTTNDAYGAITFELWDVTTDAGGGSGLDAAGVRAAVGLASANLDTQLSGIQSDTNDIQTRLPAALVSGRIDASVGAMAANVMTAAAAAADLTTELQSGLATAAALATVDTVVDAIQAKTDNLPTDPADASVIAGRFDTVDAAIAAIEPGGGLDAAGVRAAVGMASANLDTQLGGISAKTAALPSDPADASVVAAATDAILTAVGTRLATSGYTAPDNAGIAAIQAKTDSLTFTVANKLDVNLLVINGVTVIGTGTEIDKWRATGT